MFFNSRADSSDRLDDFPVLQALSCPNIGYIHVLFLDTEKKTLG